MIRVGITGQAGFIGSNLFNYLGLKEDIERIPFYDDYYENSDLLKDFVSQCQVIVHLAALNRHENPQIIYDTNIKLVKQLIDACKITESNPYIIFASSTQENKDNVYGKSKLEGRKLFEEWALKTEASFTSLIIPNVFGPFGNPYYNSVIATFSHQLINDEKPQIQVDGIINLIYINDLIEIIYDFIRRKSNVNYYLVPHSYEKKVSEILRVLTEFKNIYLKNGTIPDISNSFNLALFNTFRSFIPHPNYIHECIQHSDNRGVFSEVLRTNSGGQYSFSTTKPGITRGNHYHTRKVERFIVIKGKARVSLRRIGIDEIYEYELSGDNCAFIDMPIWYTHNLKNIGKEELITLFWVNEPFDPNNTDTFYEVV